MEASGFGLNRGLSETAGFLWEDNLLSHITGPGSLLFMDFLREVTVPLKKTVELSFTFEDSLFCIYSFLLKHLTFRNLIRIQNKYLLFWDSTST